MAGPEKLVELAAQVHSALLKAGELHGKAILFL